MLVQQMILFDQMIGRLIKTSCTYSSVHDYEALIDSTLEGAKSVLKVQKARLYGVDFNSLGQPKEMWVVGGETGNLGNTVGLNEWAGYAVKKRNSPVFSNAPRDDALWGEGYIQLEKAEKKFKWINYAAGAILMRDPLTPDGPVRPRYVLEVYNKERVDNPKHVKDMTECDAYVLGCLARTCGSAISWALGHMMHSKVVQFATTGLSSRTLELFDEVATRQLAVLFGCEDVALFWVDKGMECLWRFHTPDERAENEKLNRPLPFGPRAQVMLKESSLATEGLKKVNMSGAEEQCVVNVQNAMKHPKYNPNVDGKDTVSSLLVPIAKVTGERDIICVLQLRNKQPKNVHDSKKQAGSKACFRTDDVNFLQYFSLFSGNLFEEALELEKAKETDEYLEQSKYAVKALTSISNMLASGYPLDELFPTVCKEATLLMNCDRASLFLVRPKESGDGNELWSKIAMGIPPIQVPLKESSIAGSTVTQKMMVNIPNAYQDSRFDPTWDKKTNYRTRSILCCPVIDAQNDECLGCLQLINKRDKFDRFDSPLAMFKGIDQELARDFCSVIAIAAKNAASARNAEGSVGLAAAVADRKGGHE